MFSLRLLFYLLFPATNGAILDSRCYLEGGGSAESFLATEDLAVGSIIGRLRINGDPTADTGDINLSLREKHAPVEIVAGTKDLALAVELDKEGLRGPSSIYVNVICVRRRSTDPVRWGNFNISNYSLKLSDYPHFVKQSNLVTILIEPVWPGGWFNVLAIGFLSRIQVLQNFLSCAALNSICNGQPINLYRSWSHLLLFQLFLVIRCACCDGPKVGRNLKWGGSKVLTQRSSSSWFLG